MGSRKRFPPLCSDGSGEFGERDCDAPVRAGFDAEFVVASPEAPHERVTAHDHAGTVVAFESAHWSQPRLQSAMVGLNPIVRVLLGVVERGGDELIDHGGQRPRPIGDHLGRLDVSTQGRHEEPPSGLWVPKTQSRR
jgi:hypothetical protein